MAREDDNLHLNSLDRFSKKSPRLHLEEFSHCEVPAGCGGVVLRWIDPEKGLPLLLLLFARAEVIELFIDGHPISSSRPLVPPGRRVLALHLSGLDAGFRFAALLDLRQHGDARGDPPSLLFRSRADSTWRHAVARPPDDSWLNAGFADAGWGVLRRVQGVRPAPADPGSWAVERLRAVRAMSIGPPEAAREIWVRREFDMPAYSGKGLP
jgi:hypothetical protein